jgi:hypothetical protein
MLGFDFGLADDVTGIVHLHRKRRVGKAAELRRRDHLRHRDIVF